MMSWKQTFMQCATSFHIAGIYVINLDRRPDRLAEFIERSGLRQNIDFHRFAAVDGSKLQYSQELHDLFIPNTFKSNPGMMGCNLSHMKLWQHIAQTKNELHFILEDDARFEADWVNKWNNEFYPDLPKDAFAHAFILYDVGMAGNHTCADALYFASLSSFLSF